MTRSRAGKGVTHLKDDDSKELLTQPILLKLFFPGPCYYKGNSKHEIHSSWCQSLTQVVLFSGYLYVRIIQPSFTLWTSRGQRDDLNRLRDPQGQYEYEYKCKCKGPPKCDGLFSPFTSFQETRLPRDPHARDARSNVPAHYFSKQCPDICANPNPSSVSWHERCSVGHSRHEAGVY